MLLAIWCLAGAAAAHEVIPAIADMERQGDRLVFSVDANLESFVAGIDLEGLADTNAAPEADRYDTLREMEPEAFAEEVRGAWTTLSDEISVTVDGARLPLTLDGVEVPQVGDTELLRTSTMTFSAELPEGAQAVEFSWDSSLGDIVLRQQGVEAPYDALLQGGESTGPVQLAGGDQAGPWETFFSYIPVGIDHIVPLGLDHILFVLGLFFLAQRMGPLLWQVSAFTLAHTITLAIAALGYVSIPGSVVEPLIALSIVYVAVENIFSTGRLNPWRPVVVFCFGLLHGLGFASVLAEFGLPDNAFIPALIGFNIGVEVGQLMVIAVAYLIVVWAMRNSAVGISNKVMAAFYLAVAVVVVPALFVPVAALGAEMSAALAPLLVAAAILLGFSAASSAVEEQGSYARIVAMPASVLIAIVGAYWVVERVFL